MTPKVTVIVLNWNNAPDTLECLASVVALDYPNLEVLVVDNGSTDGSAEAIREAFPGVAVLETGENLGYAGGNNVGIRLAMERGAEYLLILNNDTTVAPTMLRELVRLMESDPRVGMAGPTVYFAEPEGTVFWTGSFVRWSSGEVRHRHMSGDGDDHGGEGPQAVDCPAGCGFLVRRQVVEETGAFDPRYFLNFEDVEWGIRARRLGWQVRHMPEAVMWHKVNASLGAASPANTYYMTRNSMLFFLTNGPVCLRPLALLWGAFRALRAIAAWSIRPEYDSEVFRSKRDANLLALRDFLIGRFGRMGVDVARVCYSP